MSTTQPRHGLQAGTALEHQAAIHLAVVAVAWAGGERPLARLRGGFNVARGRPSVIEVPPIIALRGASKLNLVDMVLERHPGTGRSRAARSRSLPAAGLRGRRDVVPATPAGAALGLRRLAGVGRAAADECRPAVHGTVESLLRRRLCVVKRRGRSLSPAGLALIESITASLKTGRQLEVAFWPAEAAAFAHGNRRSR
jgi:hypothetical protein